MAALEYHRRTEHSWSSVRAGGHGMDWSNRPVPFKVYPDLEPTPLPADLPETDLPAIRVLSGTARVDPGPLDLGGLAALLFYAAGVTRRARHRAGTIFFRAAPSAGALYPVEVYVVCRDLPGLAAGVYHFGPVDFSLRRLREGDLRSALGEAAASDRVTRSPVTLVLTGIPWRTTWKYRERGYRHLFWDAGTILGNLLAVAEARGLPARVLAGFVEEEVSRLLGLRGEDPQELPLALVPLGAAAEADQPSTDSLEPLDLAVHPLSREEIRHPLLEEAYRAGRLADRKAVERWRERAEGLGPHPATADVEEPDGPPDPIEEVILRRGSTRRFRRDPISAEALGWSLAVGSRPIPVDFVAAGASLVEPLVAVHAVEGRDPAAYRWSTRGLERLHGEASRDQTAYLCLEQALGGDAAATVFLMSPLDTVLEASGDRGYRAAQLEAGIASGRLHLAAYALGLGATGLTFYDADVRRYFRTDQEPMLVTALGVPDYRARPGRRPSETERLRLVVDG